MIIDYDHAHINGMEWIAQCRETAPEQKLLLASARWGEIFADALVKPDRFLPNLQCRSAGGTVREWWAADPAADHFRHSNRYQLLVSAARRILVPPLRRGQGLRGEVLPHGYGGQHRRALNDKSFPHRAFGFQFPRCVQPQRGRGNKASLMPGGSGAPLLPLSFQ